MDEQAMRNIGLWLFGVRQVLKGRCFCEVTEEFADENSPERQSANSRMTFHSHKRLSSASKSESKLSPVPELTDES